MGVTRKCRVMDIATFASTLMPFDTANAASEVPSEIQLLPAGGRVETVDGRGPYPVGDLQDVIAASFSDRDRIEIDVNHATFLAGPKGGPAPAVGWITSMHVRDGALWGAVEWNDEGRQMVGGKAYRGVSPVLRHAPGTKKVVRVINASLTNRPNIAGLQTLHMEGPSMDWLTNLLGLEAGATQEDIEAAIRTLMEGAAGTDNMSMNAELAQIGVAFGLPEGAEPSAIVDAARAAAGKDKEIVTLNAAIESLKAERLKDKSEAWLQEQIQNGRGIPAKPELRDALVTMHQQDPDQAQAMVDAFPDTKQTHTGGTPPQARDGDGEITLNADQRSLAKMMGISEEKYLAQLKADAKKEEAV